MPCYDPRDNDRGDPGTNELMNLNRRISALQTRLDNRTAQLCEVMALLKGTNFYEKLPAHIIEWHKEHEKFDEERAKFEKKQRVKK